MTACKYILRTLLLVVGLYQIGYSFFLGTVALDGLARDSNILDLNKSDCIMTLIVIFMSWFSILMCFFKEYTKFFCYNIYRWVFLLSIISFAISAKIYSINNSYIFIVMSLTIITLIKFERIANLPNSNG